MTDGVHGDDGREARRYTLADRVRLLNRLPRGAITRTERVALYASLQWADGEGRMFPALATWANAADLSASSLTVAIRRLTDRGILTTTETNRGRAEGGRYPSAVRVIDFDRVAAMGSEGVKIPTRRGSKTPGNSRLDPQGERSRSPGTRALDPHAVGTNIPYEQSIEHSTITSDANDAPDADAGAGGGGGDDLSSLLRRRGISAKKARELATIPGLTVPIAERIIRRVTGNDGGPGSIVLELADPDAIADARRAIETERADREAAERAEAERTEREAAEAARRAAVALDRRNLPIVEGWVVAFKRESIDRVQARLPDADRWAGVDPLGADDDAITLRALIVREWTRPALEYLRELRDDALLAAHEATAGYGADAAALRGMIDAGTADPNLACAMAHAAREAAQRNGGTGNLDARAGAGPHDAA